MSFPYFDLVLPVARAGGFVRATSLYQMAAYYLRNNKVNGIVDGGAFDGKDAIYLASLFPKATIAAFEPSPGSLSLLVEATKRTRRIVPMRLALAEQAGTATINLNTFPPTNSLLATSSDEAAQALFGGRGDTLSKAVVQTVSLDEFVKQRPTFECSLLKLDLQGYELHALRGARSTLARSTLAVISEVRFRPAYVSDALFQEIDSFLAALGFRLACLQEITHHPLDKTAFEANALWLRL